MQACTQVQGVVVPIDRPNVDTDAIIPKQFLKSIRRTGFGVNLFDEWRYLDVGQPDQSAAGRPVNPDFVLNQPRYADARIMLCRENFGCGSSREHAPWAIADYGIRALIAPSYADIFFSNCCKNGLLPVVLPADVVEALFQAVFAQAGYSLVIDLQGQAVHCPEGQVHRFDFNPALRERLLHGLDDIGVTLTQADVIRAYEAERLKQQPWLA